MKRKYTITLICICSLFVQSCSDILNVAPDGRTSLEDVFNDNDKTAAFLNSCYMNIPLKGTSYDLGINELTALCDDGYLTYSLQDHTVPRMYANGASAIVHPVRDLNSTSLTDNNYYMLYMTQLRLCTQFIANIDNAQVNSEADRARWRAEAHILRAYFISELVKWFGGGLTNLTVIVLTMIIPDW